MRPELLQLLQPLSFASPLDRFRSNGCAFHQINLQYPGLRLVSEEPYIFAIDHFFSDHECDRLIEKMEHSVERQSASSDKLLEAGERTSLSVIPRNDEVAGLRRRLAELANVQLSQLQPLKVTRYDEGGVFLRHTDCTVTLARDEIDGGARDPARFPNRFCTVLVYLNDVTRGGRTCWRWRDADPAFYRRLRPLRRLLPARPFEGCTGHSAASLCIAPRKGMAVLHFPCTSASARYPLSCDPNAEHESEATLDRKYVCQQFIWSACMDGDERVDERLREKFERFVSAQPLEPLTTDSL